ncbi:Kinesin-like protein KIN-14L [Euphorbia peplus]|nr:Kinesin-like protein KIN-14L [Euphorbia peplus]
MENDARTGFHDKLASRKAEEAAWRRIQAAEWLESLVGPLRLSSQPSEKEFVSRLRNGLILCNAINKVHPGAVPKVVENYVPLQSLSRESQPLPAYQYFENVKNFLVAIEELKLPAFEASDLERDTLEAGSAAKVVDCILALKSYHESKQMNGGNGFYKHVKSPLIMHSSGGNKSHSISSDACRRLDIAAAPEKHPPADIDIQKLADLISKQLGKDMADTKENIDGNLLQKHLMTMVKDIFERTSTLDHSAPTPSQISSNAVDPGSCRACLSKGKCKHRHLFQIQQEELVELKSILKNTRREFGELQSQFETDLQELGCQLEEMSSSALGYHRVLKENRKLYNMVQDLKGNIRVYCRIRPANSGEKSNIVHYVGEDGSLVILDPLKPKKEGRKVFQFNQVFGPTATQDQVYQDTQPLIRSVLDGYNVCIFAYGQTGSGKTYTMSGPSGGSTKDMGINYLALNDLFQMSTKRKEIIDYDIQVQMVEIYNEQVRDLLAEDSSTTRYPFICFL